MALADRSAQRESDSGRGGKGLLRAGSRSLAAGGGRRRRNDAGDPITLLGHTPSRSPLSSRAPSSAGRDRSRSPVVSEVAGRKRLRLQRKTESFGEIAEGLDAVGNEPMDGADAISDGAGGSEEGYDEDEEVAHDSQSIGLSDSDSDDDGPRGLPKDDRRVQQVSKSRTLHKLVCEICKTSPKMMEACFFPKVIQ